jgi:hypothetical protein
MTSSNGKYLDRQMNFEARRKTKTVDIPEWGCAVILRELSIAEAQQLLTDPAMRDPARQLALSIVDENGQRLFTSDDDIANLARMSSTVAARLIEQATELNGFSAAAVEAAKKNSEIPTAASAGASPAI